MSGDEWEPTAERRATARRLRELHRPLGAEAVCRWCLQRWPCRTERWSSLILLRFEREQAALVVGGWDRAVSEGSGA